jgi:hypothetical protein
MAMGRPRKYTNPDELDALVEEYFDTCDTPTMAGLALFLGFADRKAITNYAHNDTFAPVIKRARLRLEMFHEKRLSGQYPTGSIFWLKNHAEYADRQEITGANGGPVETMALTYEQAQARLAQLRAEDGDA